MLEKSPGRQESAENSNTCVLNRRHNSSNEYLAEEPFHTPSPHHGQVKLQLKPEKVFNNKKLLHFVHKKKKKKLQIVLEIGCNYTKQLELHTCLLNTIKLLILQMQPLQSIKRQKKISLTKECIVNSIREVV